MIFFISKSNDPYFNLALEECFLREYEDEVFMLWQNDNTVVVGKNQNTLFEINSDYVNEMGIRVVRRITGGGAVYHDMGNVNFTYIAHHDGEWESDFSRFAEAVINVLRELGLDAGVSGRNDIVANGKKISGNAQTVINDRILHHGTLLLNSNVSVLVNALRPDVQKIRSKGIKSVSSRVGNVSELLGKTVGAELIFEMVEREVTRLYGACVYALSDFEVKRAQKLADEKYRTWDWNYGYSPKYSFEKKGYFAGGCINVLLDVSEGKITSVKIFGDFFGISDVKDIEKALCGTLHRKEDVKRILSNFNLNNYFGKISVDEITEVFL